MTNAGSLGIRKTYSQEDYSATFEKLNYVSAFVLPAAGILAYFFTNYSTTKIVLQDSGAIEILSELLRSRFNGSNPQTSKF